MTLDEAIKHCLDIADGQDKCAEISVSEHAKERISQCAADHRQLAEWLTDYKELKNSIGAAKFSNMKEALELIREYKAENIAQKKLIAEYKQLLKAAVEDIRYLINHAKQNGKACDRCKYGNEMYCYADDCSNDAKWQHEAEALALIGKDIDAPASADGTNFGHKSGGWISCKDRLPSENTLVLCYARSTTGEGNSYFLGGLALGEFWFLKVNDIGHVSYPVPHWEVTHWQPLPEPPKEGDTNE